MRPSEIVQFDHPVKPTLSDRLVEATGGESIYWQARLDCCGALITYAMPAHTVISSSIPFRG